MLINGLRNITASKAYSSILRKLKKYLEHKRKKYRQKNANRRPPFFGGKSGRYKSVILLITVYNNTPKVLVNYCK